MKANVFKLLAEFLERAEPEVAGRGRPDPPEAIQIQLRNLARGELPAADQAGLISRLAENPQWMPFLAEAVKALRPPRTARRPPR